MLMGGFMAGAALGQQLVGMGMNSFFGKGMKGRRAPGQGSQGRGSQSYNLQNYGSQFFDLNFFSSQTRGSQSQRLNSAKMAAFKRMKARQQLESLKMPNTPLISIQNETSAKSAEQMVFEEGFTNEFKNKFQDDAAGQLLNSIRSTLSDFNTWVKKQTGGLLDLNMSLAIFFMIRGLRKVVLEKQTPSAWQLIWWASTILRGGKFV